MYVLLLSIKVIYQDTITHVLLLSIKVINQQITTNVCITIKY